MKHFFTMLLIGAVGTAGIAQTGRQVSPKKSVQPIDYAKLSNERYYQQLQQPESSVQPVQSTGPVAKQANGPVTQFNPIGSSMNVFGVLEPNGRPLSYNNELNLVSFIHRKSPSYVTNPVMTTTGAISGAIVSLFTQDWGANWDSTCVWNDATNWARYPQGGVYNVGTNTNIANSYVIVSGPVTGQATGWQGSFIGSKKLDVIGGPGNDSTASTAPGAQQFFSNTATVTATKKFDFPGLHFSSTDDGKVRMVAMHVKDYNATTSAAFGMLGANLLTGTFNSSSGTFTWAGELFLPPVRTIAAGYKQLMSKPHIAWNESGTVGYLWFIGADSTETAPENSGYQPIVYKTADGGNSWTRMVRINFQDPKYKHDVMDFLFSTASNSQITIPFFYNGEGMDGIVDANDQLHIVTTLVSTAKHHADSVGYTWPEFPNGPGADGEKYTFGQRPGFRPYVYDFYTTSNGWDYLVVDSMATESPGTKSADPGYNDNPWNANPDKVESGSRLQLTRTIDGKFLFCTWAESDTLFTNNQHKWNAFPDLHVRMIQVGNSNTAPSKVHPTELNITANENVAIAGRASMHYVSEKCLTTSTVNCDLTVSFPVTVSNNKQIPMVQDNPVVHYYSSKSLTFTKVFVCDGINEQHIGQFRRIYPNPATQQATLEFTSNSGGNAEVIITNIAGQTVKRMNVVLSPGNNEVQLNLSGISSGMYITSLRTGASVVAGKLIIE